MPVLFYEAEPFTADDLPIGGQRQPIWTVLPEAAWLKGHVGDIPTVVYTGFFPGGVLTHQVDADWWNRTEGLWELAEQVGAEQRREQRQREAQAFEAEVRRVMPQDEQFRQIALLPRPPITELRRRVAEVFPTHRVSAIAEAGRIGGARRFARQTRLDTKMSGTQVAMDRGWRFTQTAETEPP